MTSYYFNAYQILIAHHFNSLILTPKSYKPATKPLFYFKECCEENSVQEIINLIETTLQNSAVYIDINNPSLYEIIKYFNNKYGINNSKYTFCTSNLSENTTIAQELIGSLVFKLVPTSNSTGIADFINSQIYDLLSNYKIHESEECIPNTIFFIRDFILFENGKDPSKYYTNTFKTLGYGIRNSITFRTIKNKKKRLFR